MEKLKFYKIIISLLIVINILTIASVWFANSKHRGLPHDRDTFSLSKELGIQSNDKEKLDQMEKQHHHDKRKLLNENRVLREHLFGLLKKQTSDSSEVMKDVESILKNQKKIELMTYYHFAEIKKMCSPQQQVLLEETISEAIRMAGGGRPSKKQ